MAVIEKTTSRKLRLVAANTATNQAIPNWKLENPLQWCILQTQPDPADLQTQVKSYSSSIIFKIKL